MAFDSWNFRVYFIGQLLSTIGTWMQSLAQAWLVLELTDRSDQLGITVALQFTPLLVFGALGGVLTDRFENRRLIIITSFLVGTARVGPRDRRGDRPRDDLVDLRVRVGARIRDGHRAPDDAGDRVPTRRSRPPRQCDRHQRHHPDDRPTIGAGHCRVDHRPVRCRAVLLRQRGVVSHRDRRNVHACAPTNWCRGRNCSRRRVSCARGCAT